MNPNRGGEQPQQLETPPFNGGEALSDAPEKAVETPKTPESSPSRQAAPPIPVLPVLPVTDDTPIVANPTSGAGALSTNSMAASDSNRIEKQWIERAKVVIAQTKENPFAQKNEMSRVKAEYIEKRFNKKLKTDDAVA